MSVVLAWWAAACLAAGQELPPAVKAWRASLPEARPALRGFRAPVLERREEMPPIELPADAVRRRAAAVVSERLARDGLIATTAAAVEALGVPREELDADDLRAIGLPVDWLEHFDGGEFRFRPTLPGFRVATEDGEHPIAAVRVQLTGGSYWTGPGDGGCIDLFRQLLDALPEAQFFASVEEKHLASARETLSESSADRLRHVTWIPEALPVAQWAQDCGKAGLAPSSSGAGYESVTLLPRYASRGEDGATLVPGETFLADGLAAAGLRAAQSPLLFQGGDLLAARDPRDGTRLLFVGEANVWRNTALGLTREQVVEAFRAEFGVDRCVVLPAVSFHVDQELTLRSLPDRLVAFVADPVPAATIVLECGLEALSKAGRMTAESYAAAREDLRSGRAGGFLDRVAPAVGAGAVGFGRHPASFAAAFSKGPSDSGVGNLQRFLLALDLLVARTMPVDELPLDPHSIAYLRSFRRRDEDRRVLVERIRELGIEIAAIPTLPEGNRGIDHLNGVHEPGRYLMPAWGGLYEPLDRAAERAFRARLGDGIEVLPVLTSESQRRGGGIHCSISALPGG